jgi:purine-binding chemotaxis protein CheW
MSTQDAVSRVTGQFLFFRLGGQDFGAQLGSVQEILLVPHITTVPRTPGWMKGVISLRGEVLGVIDARGALRAAEAPLSPDSRLLVVQEAEFRVALLVDSVSEAAQVAAGELIPLTNWSSEGQVGLGFACDRGGSIHSLIDLKKLITLPQFLPFQ